jgi:hypothetical protein
VLDSGFATSRSLTAGSVLTIYGVKFRLIWIVDQPQAKNPPDVYVPLKVAGACRCNRAA